MLYKSIYEAYGRLSKGDLADLKRCDMVKMGSSPAYFRVLKFTGAPDNPQTLRILFLFSGIDVETDEERSISVAGALAEAGVKERNIIQITRSGDNSIEYLKRQLVRCKHVSVDDLGRLAQYWGDYSRRNLLKQFILIQED